MVKISGRLSRNRANKSGNINTNLCNFLENLLVFRTLDELTVPQESGVKFRISREEGGPGICLLIHVDDQLFPIVERGVPRPDYLAVYLHGDGCICTIIEMKSTAGKNLKHGLEQIKVLADRLNKEFQDHLPRRFKLKVQGILLSQFNSQVPPPLIEKMADAGLTILNAQCGSRAELYPYIFRLNSVKTSFLNKPRTPGPATFIETMISRDSLAKRVPDQLTEKREGAGPGTGLHINFVLSLLDEYAALITRGNKCVFVVSEQGEQFLGKLQADIAANGLQDKFEVERMPEVQEP